MTYTCCACAATLPCPAMLLTSLAGQTRSCCWLKRSCPPALRFSRYMIPMSKRPRISSSVPPVSLVSSVSLPPVVNLLPSPPRSLPAVPGSGIPLTSPHSLPSSRPTHLASEAGVSARPTIASHNQAGPSRPLAKRPLSDSTTKSAPSLESILQAVRDTVQHEFNAALTDHMLLNPAQPSSISSGMLYLILAACWLQWPGPACLFHNWSRCPHPSSAGWRLCHLLSL